MASIFTSEELRVVDLSLWDENARFPDKYFNKSESELIDYFLDKKNFKVKDLAQEIVNDIDLPQVEKLIVYKTDDKYVVLEGNRRLVAYKLLLDPNKTSQPELRTYFETLNKAGKLDSGGLKLECLVTDNKEQGLRYIDRKHLKSNNEVGWGDNERAHHNARRGSANKKEQLKVGITKLIQNLDIPDELKEKVLGQGYVTTFWRMIEQSSAWDEFGFSINEQGELSVASDNFEDKLKVIINDVLKKSTYNDKIFSRLDNKEIGSYLKDIDEEKIKQAREEVKENTSENLFGEQSVELAPGNKIKVNPKSSLRSYLIPKQCRLTISETKINNIYRELQSDLLLDDSRKAVPNAVGVLFRVFLETSIDYYWEKKGHVFVKDTKLAGKITKVAQHLQDSNIATANQLKNIRTVATDKNNLLAIETFHSYVHDYKTQPSPSDLKLKWDNLQEFFEIIYTDLNTKKATKK